jgi:hypothetical protein
VPLKASQHWYVLRGGKWVEIPGGDMLNPSPERASLPKKARRLGAALVRWTRGGWALAERRARAGRRAACLACPYWRSGGNLGMGECTAPGCGCSRFKRWLATERCPLGKWPGEALQSRFRGPARAEKPALILPGRDPAGEL